MSPLGKENLRIVSKMKLHHGLGAVVYLMILGGCATPQSISSASDYEVCRVSLLRPTLLSNETINQANYQVRLRGIDCSRYAQTIYQRQDEGIRELQGLSRDLMTTPNYGAKAYKDTQPQIDRQKNARTKVKCFLKSSSVSGSYKTCRYDCMGSTVFESMPYTDFCPSTIER
jgi:hypothetical protein